MNSTLGFPLLISMRLAVMLANFIYNKFKMSTVLVIINYCSTMHSTFTNLRLSGVNIIKVVSIISLHKSEVF